MQKVFCHVQTAEFESMTEISYCKRFWCQFVRIEGKDFFPDWKFTLSILIIVAELFWLDLIGI